MNQYQHSYQSQKFAQLLKQLQKEEVSGILYVSSQINSNDHAKHALRERILSRVLVWKNGGIVYADSRLISPQEIAKKLLQKLNPKTAEIMLKFAMEQMNDSSSAREYLLFLTKIAALKWQPIEAYIQTQVASVLEQISFNSGTARLDTNHNFDLSFGKDEHSLNWSNLNQELKQRRQKWDTFTPEIPSLNAIPQAQSHKLATIPKVSIRDHIQQYIDGKRSLMEIANELDKDPLNIAHSYYSWVNSGWISFDSNNSNSPSNVEKEKLGVVNSKPDESNNSGDLPTVLSVDDSLIVQASIKRALKDDYNLLLCDNALDALKILNNNKIDLLLLDVTMPDIDGLEMCKTLRNIPKFKNLPIVMVTARDNFFDKVKGQIAGTNHYLTKPFDPEKLRKVINKFI